VLRIFFGNIQSMSEKKYYVVGAISPESWERIHTILMQDGTLDDNIPSRSVECADLKEHSPTRSVYLLTDEEAEQLRNCPDVRFIHLDKSYYPEIFPKPPADDFHYRARYTTPAKHYRKITSYPNPTTTADINRAGYQILRGTSYANPWAVNTATGTTATTVILSTVTNVTGTGKDVDVIVGDEGCWFGHVEFANNTGTGPADYIGGNVLPGNGTCDLLDLILDGPYYIDPAWFNANPGSRLTTRWDGTIVPTESAARDWWGSGTNRSSQFASAGTIVVPIYYTRANCNGSNTAKPDDGYHGTPCSSQTYGRTHGWAYNSNKWIVNVYGNNGLFPIDNYFDAVKIFHQTKPVNPTYGTKDPSITSNSWGYRANQGNSGYYYFRQGASGAGGVAYASKPAFMQYLGSAGDGGRFKGEMLDNTLTAAGDEAIAAGVIFVVASGNSNQQQVTSSHPNYNNYWSSGAATPLTSATHSEFGEVCYNTINRRGFPQHIGKYYVGTATIYPAINIGALDDDYTVSGLERKVAYSDMGNDIDVFTPGDDTLTATWGSGLLIPRHDQRGGGSLTSHDGLFNGTSSACPTACGMIATALEYNRNWTFQDIRTWLQSLNNQSSSTFYIGIDPPTATSTQWSDLNSLMGAAPRVLYNNIPEPVNAPPLTATVAVSTLTLSYNSAMTPVVPVVASGGTVPYAYSLAPSLPTGIAFSTSTGQLSGTPTQLRSTGTYTVTVIDSTATSVSRSFRLSVTTTPLTVTLSIPSRAMTVLAATSFIPVTASGGFGIKTYSISPNNLNTFGLTFNSTTGAISGTPTQLKNPALYTITVVDQAGQSGSKNVTLSVVATAINAIVNTATVSFFAFQAISSVQPVNYSGGSGAITYSISPVLPNGLAFSTSTGIISGTPIQVKPTTVYTVTITDQFSQTASANFNLTVAGVPIFATTTVPLRTLVIGEPVVPFIPISATGGSGVKTYSLNQPLPQGMTLNTTNGQISGTPTFLAGSAVYTMTVTDQVGQEASTTFILRIRSNQPLIFTDEQNLIWTELNNLMGTTSTGYGTALISQPVTPGATIYPDDFNLMIEDMVKAIVHQKGTGTNATIQSVNRLRFAEDGTPITRVVSQRLWTELQFLKVNPATVHPSNLTFMTVNTNIDADTTVTSTTTSIGLNSQAVEWIDTFSNGSANSLLTSFIYAWRRVSDANYFFNSGGRFQPLFGEFDFYGNVDEENRWVGTESNPGPIRQAAEIVFGKNEYLYALANNNEWVQYFYETEESETTRTVELRFQVYEDFNGYGSYYRSVIASIQFLIGPVGKKKNKTKKKKKKGVSVNFRTRCSFKTTYATSKFGGISSPRPQSQRSNGLQSDSLVPLAPFSIGLDAANNVASRRVYLQNNSPVPAQVTNISLTPNTSKYPQSAYPELYPGYSEGYTSVSSMFIPPHTTRNFTVYYTASVPGSYKGYIFIDSNVNDLVLFTEINVGDVNPGSWTSTATTNAIISEDFTVNLGGGLYRGFTATIVGTGFTIDTTSRETFRINYNPRNSIPGTYFTTATVNILPADPINGLVRVDIPVQITANVLYENIATFLSATGLDNNVVGLSYDYIGGERFLTVGIGASTPVVNDGVVDITELREEFSTFDSWAEVYRIKVGVENTVHYLTTATCVKVYDFSEGRSVSSFFRANRTISSMLNINDYGTGDLRINMNNFRDFQTIDGNELRTLKGIQNAFFYYDETVDRITQLEYPNEFIDGYKTRHFVGFNRDGTVVTSLVNPNLQS
jgi:hypothetical protein